VHGDRLADDEDPFRRRGSERISAVNSGQGKYYLVSSPEVKASFGENQEKTSVSTVHAPLDSP
jgi:hypothetical protein